MALRCFVAMAFDHADTDEWFDKTLTPLLRKELGATVRRVDRLEHNDDIDDRIIREIEAADFVVADLTYARPSVYYEAGYAQRHTPVIYTVRADHFRRTEDPEREHLRVHFDLSMKNIIAWKTPADPAFARRMRTRLNFVTAPMRRQIENKAQRQAEAKEFAALPVVRRMTAAIETLSSTVERDKAARMEPLPRNRFARTTRASGRRYMEGVLYGVQARIDESLTVGSMRELLKTTLARPQFNIQLPTATDQLDRVFDLCLLLSLRSVPLARITSGLYVFGVVDEQAKHLRWVGDEDWPVRRVPGYVEVKPSSSWDRDFDAVRRNGDRVRLQNKGGVLAAVNGKSTAVPVDSVARVVDVVVIDQIVSVTDVVERTKAALARWRAGAALDLN